MEGMNDCNSRCLLARAKIDIVQYIFLIYGSVTMGVGILVFFALPDSPSKAWFFNAEEKKAAVIRLAENQTGVNSHKVRSLQKA